MKTIVIIPARMASARLPGKPLKKINGKSIILECYCNALFSIADEVYVCSPDEEIFQEIIKNKGKIIKTSKFPINGTERVAEAARVLGLKDEDIVVNLQGDMPFFDPEIIGAPIKLLQAMNCNVTSVMRILSSKDQDNPNRVKVNIDKKGIAVFFGRKYTKCSYHHIGIYVFRNWILQEYAKCAPSASEICESLEQKRMDILCEPIWMSYVNSRPIVIDTKEDLVNAQNF